MDYHLCHRVNGGLSAVPRQGSSPTENEGLTYYDTPSNEKMDINRGFLTTGEIV